MYDKMFVFVKNYLESSDGEPAKTGCLPFRKRSEHIRRVFLWAKRLIEGEPFINQKAVLTAALFHDIGYALSSEDSKHADYSTAICEGYLKENNFDSEFRNLVVYLVKNHSNKELMKTADTPLELILLMEADLLDETGALSIVLDCMTEGSKETQTFEKTYQHILNYSYKALRANPMVTGKGKLFWESKQHLMETFIEHLSFDLGLQEPVS